MAKIWGEDKGKRFILAEVCGRCYDEAIDNGQTEAEIATTMDGNGQDRFCFDIYAGHLCDRHWRKSGYVSVTDPNAQFDPDFAGERLEPED